MLKGDVKREHLTHRGYKKEKRSDHKSPNLFSLLFAY